MLDILPAGFFLTNVFSSTVFSTEVFSPIFFKQGNQLMVVSQTLELIWFGSVQFCLVRLVRLGFGLIWFNLVWLICFFLNGGENTSGEKTVAEKT